MLVKVTDASIGAFVVLSSNEFVQQKSPSIGPLDVEMSAVSVKRDCKAVKTRSRNTSGRTCIP